MHIYLKNQTWKLKVRTFCASFCINITLVPRAHITAQKNKFFIKNFLSKCVQIRRKLRICSHLLKKSLMENLIFGAVGGSRKVKKKSHKLILDGLLIFGGTSNTGESLSVKLYKLCFCPHFTYDYLSPFLKTS